MKKRAQNRRIMQVTNSFNTFNIHYIDIINKYRIFEIVHYIIWIVRLKSSLNKLKQYIGSPEISSFGICYSQHVLVQAREF